VDRSSRENKPLLFSRQANLIGLRAAEYRARVCGCGKKTGTEKTRLGGKKKEKRKKENNRPFRSMHRRVRALKGPARNAEIRRKGKRALSKRRETFAEWKTLGA